MSEIALIERIARGTRIHPGTTLGIGDDAAVLALGGDAVVTHDMLVEGVHFRRATTGMRDLGWKALGVNLSDLAAMGAEPVAVVVGLGLPAGRPAGEAEELAAGVEELARRHGVTVAGGDVTSAPVLTIGITAVGRPQEGVEPVTRAGGRPGDLLCVTGALGGSGAGLALLDDPHLLPGLLARAALIDRHRRPDPRLDAGRALARHGARAMIDLSDGLALDARRLARASGVRIRIDGGAVPIAPGVAAVAVARGEEPLRMAVGAGEDYELLAAVAPDAIDALAAAVPGALTVIGALTGGEGPPVEIVAADGRPLALDGLGWEHRV